MHDDLTTLASFYFCDKHTQIDIPKSNLYCILISSTAKGTHSLLAVHREPSDTLLPMHVRVHDTGNIQYPTYLNRQPSALACLF